MTDPGALRIRAAVNQELRHRVQHALRSAPDVSTQPAHSAHPRRHALLGRTFRPTAAAPDRVSTSTAMITITPVAFPTFEAGLDQGFVLSTGTCSITCPRTM